MTGPLYPEGEPAAPTPDTPPPPDPQYPESGYAPSVFMADYQFPPGGSVKIPPLPQSDGGLIQSVKSATVLALRDALSNITLADSDQAINISLEYPLEPLNYPSIFVQFSVSKLNRSGVGHEVQVQDPDTQEWSFIQEWTFMGRITLQILALSSVDRDQLADSVISSLAFARPPELLLTKPQADTKQHRGLITALDENPYVAMALQLDVILPGGQTVSQGTPFAENWLTYEDSYSFDLVGQFNLQYSHDGMYTLARIDASPVVSPTSYPYNGQIWQPPVGPPGIAPFNASGQTNVGNTDYPVL